MPEDIEKALLALCGADEHLTYHKSVMQPDGVRVMCSGPRFCLTAN